MRKTILLLSVLLFLSGTAWAQGRVSGLGDLARKVRAERAKKGPSRATLYTNDNLPNTPFSINVMGRRAAAPKEGNEAEGEAAASGEEAKDECNEQCWRNKFSEKRRQIRSAEQELDVLQREFNLSRTQHYQDPNAAMREQYSNTSAGGRQLQDLLNRMEQKKRDVERLNREISSLEREMRRAGGQPGWARE